MSKILIIPSNKKEIYAMMDIVDGFIIGIKGMSVNTNFDMDIKDIDILKDICDKEIFISLNKNMHNIDLSIIKEILIKLNEYNIKGVLFYDIGILNIYNELNLNYDLVLSQEHLTTNYNTINYWYSKGSNYAYISSDITEEEIIDIKKNTKAKLMVNLFGYLPMFVSKRHIVKNYLEYFNLKDCSKINYMEKEDKIYPIIDNNVATVVYSNNILNGLKSYLNLDIEYAVLNSFNIDSNKFMKVIKIFKDVNLKNIEEYDIEINKMFKNVDSGFLNTKTIYRVKKNDK